MVIDLKILTVRVTRAVPHFRIDAEILLLSKRSHVVSARTGNRAAFPFQPSLKPNSHGTHFD